MVIDKTSYKILKHLYKHGECSSNDLCKITTTDLDEILSYLDNDLQYINLNYVSVTNNNGEIDHYDSFFNITPQGKTYLADYKYNVRDKLITRWLSIIAILVSTAAAVIAIFT